MSCTSTLQPNPIIAQLTDNGIRATIQSGPGPAGQDAPDVDVQYADTTDVTYVYYGMMINNAWKINRWTRNNPTVKTSATVTNNGSYTTLAAAWATRTGLTYA